MLVIIVVVVVVMVVIVQLCFAKFTGTSYKNRYAILLFRFCFNIYFV